jgi:DNA-binding NtrC family response regulator
VIVEKSLRKVFIVDNEHLIAATLTEILQKDGFAATYFTNPREALSAAQKEVPDLLLSEVGMAELSGIELAIAIQQNCPACKIMLFSGREDTHVLVSKAREQGYDFPVLYRPMHPTELLRRLHRQTPT